MKIISFIRRFQVVAIFVLSTIMFIQYKSNQKQVAQLSNNLEYYIGKCTNSEEQNRVLQLRTEDLQTSNDSLVQHMEVLRKELDISKKKLRQASVVQQQIENEFNAKIDKDLKNFKHEEIINDNTIVFINRFEEDLDVKLNISNILTILYWEDKVYRRKYKNGFRRFCNFDWKKDKILRFEVHNTNPVIENTDTRVVKMTK